MTVCVCETEQNGSNGHQMPEVFEVFPPSPSAHHRTHRPGSSSVSSSERRPPTSDHRCQTRCQSPTCFIHGGDVSTSFAPVARAGLRAPARVRCSRTEPSSLQLRAVRHSPMRCVSRNLARLLAALNDVFAGGAARQQARLLQVSRGAPCLRRVLRRVLRPWK